MSFAIRSRGGKHPLLPVELMDGYQSSTDIELIVDPILRPEVDHMWMPGQPKIGRYFLPPFQRPLVWTETQKVRFVESAHLGITLGSIVIVDAMNCPMVDGRYAQTDRWLLDGQQRVSALLAYVNDEFSVFAGTEVEHRWSDLSEVEKRRFHHTQIGLIKVHTDDPNYCRVIYDRLNFGGTAHTPDQRATTEDQS